MAKKKEVAALPVDTNGVELSGEMQMKVIENMISAADDINEWMDIRKRVRGTSQRYEPTARDRTFVLWRMWAGQTQGDIARVMGMDTDTLRSHFRDELDLGLDGLITALTKTLAAKALAGDTTSLMFFLRTRGGEAWRDKKEAPVTVNITPTEQKSFDPDRVQQALDVVAEKVLLKLKRGGET
jgi:hypothetical protein